MARLACVNIFDYPLQILRRVHPEWLRAPLAVVEARRPDATIIAANKPARKAGIYAGMELKEASALQPDLRAEKVDPEWMREGTADAQKLLREYTPFVRPLSKTSGLFWLDASGLEGLFESLESWARQIHDRLESEATFFATVVVGFTQFGTYTLAGASRGILCFESRPEESNALRHTSIRHLDIPARHRQMLAKLGIETIGDFLELPPTGLQKRFGKRIKQLHRTARDQLSAPFESNTSSDQSATRQITLSREQANIPELIFHIKFTLNQFLESRTRDEGIKTVELEFERDDGSVFPVKCRWAEPIRDLENLTDLIRLRLENKNVHRKNNLVITGLSILAQFAEKQARSLSLFDVESNQARQNARQILQRLKAELGQKAVIRAERTPGLRPEDQFEWQPIETLPGTRDNGCHSGSDSLVRRIWTSPVRWPRFLEDRRPTNSTTGPPSEQWFEQRPYVISGRWWAEPCYRIYRYCRLPDDTLLWIYYDKRSEQWFVQGRLE